MSDSVTGGPVQFPATTGATPSSTGASPREPLPLLVLDVTTGLVVAGNPAGRQRITGASGATLGHHLAALAVAAGRDRTAVTHTWAGSGAEGDAVRVCGTRIAFHRQDCLLVVLRDGGCDGCDGCDDDPTCAAFTLDAVGRIDSWGPGPQRLVGYRAAHVIGADTTLLLPPAARVTGEHHRALNQAYRCGDHRAEGWRVRADGRLIWAEVATVPLYDGFARFLGFAQVLQDRTRARRLHARGPLGGIPAQHGPREAVPAGSALRALPAQRRR